MCVTDRGVGFEEEGESGFERECGLSEKAERGEGHSDYPLGEIMLGACCEHGAEGEAEALPLPKGLLELFDGNEV